jgi:DtxR family transcriptional regulator, Mn-dependent transcriptional regulator
MADEPRPTPTIEDYLGAIYTLDRDGQAVIGRRLAEWMEVSPPTVTVTIQRMVRDGWVVMDADKTIHLTDAGRQAAASVLRRHMLTELLLARVLNVPWSQVHAEAHQLEHGLSADTAARVEDLLEGMIVCPHGNPLPGEEDRVSDWIPLLEAEAGREYELARVHEEVERNGAMLAYLEAHGLVPGATLILLSAEAQDDDLILLSVEGITVSVSRLVGRCLWVKER